MLLVCSLLPGLEVMTEGQVGVRGQESLAEEKGLSSPDLFWENHLTSLWVSFHLRILQRVNQMFFQGSFGSEKFP